MNKKTIYAVVAVIVVVLVVGVAGILLLNNNAGNGGTTPTPTPTPATVVGANTLQFSVNETTSGATVTYQFACKNYNTSSEVIRVDIPGGSAGNYTYVMDAHAETSKMSSDNGATWTSDTFASDWTNFGSAFNTYVDKLAVQGNTNDLTYTAGSSTYTIYCVAVNGTIADSFFSTS